MKLDKINNKIITKLINNCRITNIEIGKKVGLSREGVACRIRALENEKIISGYGAEIDVCRLGFQLYETAIQLQNINPDEEKRMLLEIKNNEKIIFIEKTLGRFDWLLMFKVRGIKELDAEIEWLRSRLGEKLKDINISAWVANYDTMSSFFTETQFYTVTKLSDEPPYQLDDIEKNLLKELAYNSTESAVNLAQKLDVSAITIANKIKKLEKDGIIKNLRAFIDFEKLGVYRYSIFLNAHGSKTENKLAEFCKNHKLIADFTKFIGRYNYSIEVFAHNNSEFKKVIDELISVFSKEIIEYETSILLEEIKHIPFSI